MLHYVIDLNQPDRLVKIIGYALGEPNVPAQTNAMAAFLLLTQPHTFSHVKIEKELDVQPFLGLLPQVRELTQAKDETVKSFAYEMMATLAPKELMKNHLPEFLALLLANQFHGPSDVFARGFIDYRLILIKHAPEFYPHLWAAAKQHAPDLKNSEVTPSEKAYRLYGIFSELHSKFPKELAQAVDSEDPVVRYTAYHSLTSVNLTKETAAKIVARLGQENRAVTLQLCLCLQRLNLTESAFNELRPVLAYIVKEHSVDHVSRVLPLIEGLGDKGIEFVPGLVERMKKAKPEPALTIAKSILRIDPKRANETLPVFERLLTNTKGFSQENIMNELATLGPVAKPLLPYLKPPQQTEKKLEEDYAYIQDGLIFVYTLACIEPNEAVKQMGLLKQLLASKRFYRMHYQRMFELLVKLPENEAKEFAQVVYERMNSTEKGMQFDANMRPGLLIAIGTVNEKYRPEMKKMLDATYRTPNENAQKIHDQISRLLRLVKRNSAPIIPTLRPYFSEKDLGAELVEDLQNYHPGLLKQN